MKIVCNNVENSRLLKLIPPDFCVIILVTALFLYSCSNNNITQREIQTNDTSTFVNPKKGDQYSVKDSLMKLNEGKKEFSYKVSKTYGGYTMEVETFCLNDTLDISYSYDSTDIWPIILSQQVIFKHNDSITKQFYVPLRKKERKDHSGKLVTSLDAFIWNLSTLKGANGILFRIDASGTCEGKTCPDFIGLYSLSGDSILQEYTNEENTGKLNEILIKYGISEDTFRFSSDNGIRVDIYR
jgi:hypothetical protein